MHDTTALVRPAASDYTPADNPRFVELHTQIWNVLRDEVLEGYAQQLRKAA